MRMLFTAFVLAASAAPCAAAGAPLKPGSYASECRPDLTCTVEVQPSGKEFFVSFAAASKATNVSVCVESVRASFGPVRMRDGGRVDAWRGSPFGAERTTLALIQGDDGSLMLQGSDNAPCGFPLATNGIYAPAAPRAQSLFYGGEMAVGGIEGEERFDRVYREKGLAGALEEAEACYRELKAGPSLRKLTACSTFDLKARATDAKVAAQLSVSPRPYFAREQVKARFDAGLAASPLVKEERAAIVKAFEAGLAPNGIATASRAESLQTAEAARPWDHNGSEVSIDSAAGLISYSRPKSAIAGVVRRGDVLFRGRPWSDDAKISGTAYVFKKGCAPAPYEVAGGLVDGGDVVLRGAAPVRAKTGCEIVGYRADSPNAVLKFEWIPGDEPG